MVLSFDTITLVEDCATLCNDVNGDYSNNRCYWFARGDETAYEIGHMAAQAYCKRYPEAKGGGRLPLPVKVAEWQALDNFVTNSLQYSYIDTYWLGAHFTGIPETFSNIEWIYNGTFCHDLTYNSSTTNAELEVDDNSATQCIYAAYYNPTEWHDAPCTGYDVISAVCEFGTVLLLCISNKLFCI